MPNNDAVRDFLQIVEHLEDALVPTVDYVSQSRGEDRVLMRGRLRFKPKAIDVPKRFFEWNGVAAESFTLADVGKMPREFIDEILAGQLMTPNGRVIFEKPQGLSFATKFFPLHPDGLERQTRIAVLQILGEQNVPFNYAPLDWDLRAANPPYDSLTELFLDYELGAPSAPSSIFETIISDIVAMDYSCKVDGTTIEIAAFAIPGIEIERVSVGYRLFDRGIVVDRQLLEGNKFSWSEVDGNRLRGSLAIKVPPAAVLHCYACYEGRTYNDYWFGDPTVPQNHRRATYEQFDPKLDLLRELFVTRERRRARELENGVAWLLWMLGFGTLHLGATKLMQDGPDLIATTPSEHYAVVECTTGQIKGESKLERLVARAAMVRDRLLKSNHPNLRVLPVMVTSMTRAEVAAGIEAARANGVVVLTQEDLLNGLTRTLVLPRPDDLYADAERSLTAT